MTYDKEVVLCFGISFSLNAWSDPAAFRRPHEIGWKNNEQRKIEQRFSYEIEMKTRKQTRKNKWTETERFDCFIGQIQTVRCFWLVKRTFGWKNVMPGNFLEINQSFALTSYCNTIGQLNNAFFILGFSLVGNRRVHVLFIHWLIKQITLTETIFQGHTKIDLTMEPHSQTKELLFSSSRRCQNMGVSVHCYFFVFSSDRRCPLGKR